MCIRDRAWRILQGESPCRERSNPPPTGVTERSVYIQSGCLIRHSYSEVGKAGHKGKDLTEARSLHRKLMLDKWYVGLDKDETTSMQGITTES